jgi:hypothetical protein
MTGPDPIPEHPIDDLVLRHLRRQSDTVDPGLLLQRVRARAGRELPRTAPLRSGRRHWSRLVLGLAASIAIVIAFLGGRHARLAQAQPETLLREARQIHDLPVDRCYLVQSVPDPSGPLAGRPLFGQPRETRLWTRGDRFWVESTRSERTWAWGQDEQGNIWLALGGQRGVQFAPGEAPEGVLLAAEVCTLRLDTLLDLLMTRCELTREYPEGPSPGATLRIVARPRPGAGATRLRSAVLDLDAETRVLRRLVLERNTLEGRPLATVTFTLIDSQPQDDQRYLLRGHLANPDAPPVLPRPGWNELLGPLMR